jgi:hypothetical protein
MAMRSFHMPQFRQTLEQHGLIPLYFIAPHYFQTGQLDPARYFELKTDQYNDLFERQRLLRDLAELRRFVVRTETTDLRFRESIDVRLFNHGPVAKAWVYAAGMDILRRVPGLGHLAAWCEDVLFPLHVHERILKEEGVGCVLTPGTGSYGFWNEGLFAREARRLGLPVFAAITNYDNIVNMGFRGFMPDCLAVWSRQMADEAIRFQRIPAHRIEITGPVQYDRYFSPLPISRDEFLRSKGLDPDRKTILYAGGVNITRYFEIYRLFVAGSRWNTETHFNLVIRPYPHVKLLSSPGWKVLEPLFSQAEGVYISNALDTSSDRLVTAELQRDLTLGTEEVDELYCLLKYSDVMINLFSTISLEAAICDLPVIHIGYDEYTFGHHYSTSTAFQQRQTHNRRKLRLAAARIAKSEEDLVKYLDLYLADRTIDAGARHEYALAECKYLDGKSSHRLAAMIRSRLGASK